MPTRNVRIFSAEDKGNAGAYEINAIRKMLHAGEERHEFLSPCRIAVFGTQGDIKSSEFFTASDYAHLHNNGIEE